MQDLRANAEETGADEESEVEISPARSVEDPVEAGGEAEEGYAMQDFVIDHGVDL